MLLEQPIANYNGKPEIDDGHTKIANELLDAILLHDFSKRQLKIILFIMRKTYGWNKTADDISRSQIIDATKISNPNITTTIQELLEMNVIIVSEGSHAKRYQINKYYDTWRVINSITIIKTITKRYQNNNNSLSKQDPQKTTSKDNTKDSENFDIFWKRYPKKVEKKKSFEKWLRIKPDLNLIMKALEWQIPKWAKDNFKYVPNALTYLNGERWNDEPDISVILPLKVQM